MFLVLVVNPGSTSTKVALFRGEKVLFSHSIHHDTETLARFETINDQTEFRTRDIFAVLTRENITLEKIDAFVGRGGLLKPIPSGTYSIDKEMIHDLTVGVMGEHASNLGGIIVNHLSSTYRKPAFIVDPVVVDELQDMARLSGHPLMPRKSIFHALNQKSVARQAAKKLGRAYETLSLIVAHLGGGISIGAHKNGRVIDVNNALDGDGPFSPERSGTLPVGELTKLCFTGRYTLKQVQKMIKGEGGLVAYLGTNDIQRVRELTRIEGESSNSSLVYRSMAYQVSKYIGAMAVVLEGNVDSIVLTGGITFDEQFVKYISDYVSFLGPIIVIPGEEEMGALAMGALRVLRGKETAKNYKEQIITNDLNFSRIS